MLKIRCNTQGPVELNRLENYIHTYIHTYIYELYLRVRELADEGN